MAQGQPRTARQYLPDDARPVTTWAQACRRLAEATTYWLGTVRPDGRPHVVPVLSVWLDGALYFCAGATTRKARNLAQNPACVITAGTDDLDLVVEGTAVHVSDAVRLERVAGAYRSKYGWEPAPRDGAFYGEGAPTAGPPPLDAYAVAPQVAFGFGTGASLNAMRWSFSP
jgi:nitroimidazol reductase NimA-like FMN-containing flavoprotein (pyridoxamine 5'-phosphate oxidase superfamily)